MTTPEEFAQRQLDAYNARSQADSGGSCWIALGVSRTRASRSLGGVQPIDLGLEERQRGSGFTAHRSTTREPRQSRAAQTGLSDGRTILA